MRKITRDAFLYFDNPRQKGDFAQCGSCTLMNEYAQCEVFGSPVNRNDSCGLYIPGERGLFQRKTNSQSLVSKKEGGFIERAQVRCENCFYGGEHCGLFQFLNNTKREYFDLNTKISPKGCCNAWTPK